MVADRVRKGMVFTLSAWCIRKKAVACVMPPYSRSTFTEVSLQALRRLFTLDYFLCILYTVEICEFSSCNEMISLTVEAACKEG